MEAPSRQDGRLSKLDCFIRFDEVNHWHSRTRELIANAETHSYPAFRESFRELRRESRKAEFELVIPQKRLVSERIQRFADQGKKLNLYLAVITQQPGKLHSDVLSEFNNRIILRVNERRSLKVLEETYGGFKGRYDGALTFEPGEALIEGALLMDENPPPPGPRGVQFKPSRSREGGGTPKPDWALPRA